jgi:hypothetical protein
VTFATGPTDETDSVRFVLPDPDADLFPSGSSGKKALILGEKL